MTHKEMVEWFACRVCDKPRGLDPDECHATVGRQNPLCRDHDCCRIEEKSDEQLDYVKSPIDRNIFLRACPGSGKTEVVGLKAAYEIKNWNRAVGGIAVLTFTNNAANVIHERVCQFAGIERAGYPHFVGTIDSWLHGYVAHPFAHSVTEYDPAGGDFSIRVVDPFSKAPFLNSYKTQYSLNETGNPSANQYYLDRETNAYVFASGKQSLDARRNGSSLAEWQLVDLRQTKARFCRDGYATYQDIENICFSVLSANDDLTNRLARRFPFIIVDESQDLSGIQLRILKILMDAGSNLHFVGDLNQAIYEFKKVSPEAVHQFALDHRFTEMPLTANFRSCQTVVDICKLIVNADDGVTGLCQSKMATPCLFLIYPKNSISVLPNWFEQFVTEKNLDVSDSAIVARGTSTMAKLRPAGSSTILNYQKRLAMAIYLWQTGDIQAMENSLTYLARFVVEKWPLKCYTNPRACYCPDWGSSPLRWRLFLADVLNSSLENPDVADLDQPWSSWSTQIRSHFGKIVRTSQPMLLGTLNTQLPPFPDLDSHSFTALKGKSGVAVVASLGNIEQTKHTVRITTIHGVKGETMDAIMLVSATSRQGPGDGHWTQWLEDPSSEAARLAYVASSRPRHLLVWAVPKEKGADYSKLTQMGLSQYDH